VYPLPWKVTLWWIVRSRGSRVSRVPRPSIWPLRVVESTLLRLKRGELLSAVYGGMRYKDGE